MSLGVTKAAGLGVISLRVANLLDGLKGQENGGRSLARSEFWQFLREEMMFSTKTQWEEKSECQRDFSGRELVIDGAQRVKEKEDSKISLIRLLWKMGKGLHSLVIPPERLNI